MSEVDEFHLQRLTQLESVIAQLRELPDRWRSRELDPWVDCDCGNCVKKELADELTAVLGDTND